MKNTKIIVFIIFVLVTTVTIYYFASNRPKTIKEPTSSQAQKGLSSQADSQGSMTVKVTPKNITEFSSSWDFEIVLDTHTDNLVQDLTKLAVLIDDKGNTFSPTSWEGDPPGGHHRSGVLQFMPIFPSPKSIELKIYEKYFKWYLIND